MRRVIILLAAAAVLGTAAVAYAAGLGPLGAGSVGVNGAAVAPCDTDGFTISYQTSSGNVTQATIGGIKEPDCAGGQLSLTLTNGSGASIGSGGPVAVPSMADPGQVTVTMSGPLAYAGDVAGFQAVIVGP
jgi:hypothetical protein